MAEMRTLDCPACATPNQPSAVTDEIGEYRCRACGMVYYGPSGCDTADEVVSEGAGSDAGQPADFQMQRPTPARDKTASGSDEPGVS
jgi:hypothetical protein